MVVAAGRIAKSLLRGIHNINSLVTADDNVIDAQSERGGLQYFVCVCNVSGVDAKTGARGSAMIFDILHLAGMTCI